MSGTMLAAGDTVASKSPTFTELRGVVSKFQSLQVPVGKKGFPGGASGKEHACQCRRCKRRGFDPCIRKIPGGGRGNPLQYSCLENPTERGIKMNELD